MADYVDKDWEAEVARRTAALPTAEGTYIGDTYVWELEGREWTPLNAPYGMSGPEFDGELKPYLQGSAERVASIVLKFAAESTPNIDVDTLAKAFAEHWSKVNYIHRS